MKSNLLVSLITTLACLISFNDKAVANDTKFVCTSWENVPTTVAQRNDRTYPVIRWVSKYFENAGYDPQSRCETVSAQFQLYHEQGILKYLTTGSKNGENIVCVAEIKDGPCVGQLFTLPPQANPKKALQQLIDVATRNTGEPINQSGTRLYVDIEDIFNQ